MIVRSAAWLLAVCFFVPSAFAQPAFQMNNTALPPFGGYVPGSNNTVLPPFGGYTPGAGATIRFSNRGNFSLRQGSAPLALPPFGRYVPGTGATFSYSLPRRASNRSNQAGLRGAPGNAGANQAAVRAAPAHANAVANGQARNQAGRGQTVRDQRRQRAAEDLLRKGQRAEADGNLALARSYYQRGLKRDAPGVNETLRKQLAAIK
jgi:hypothetical protein